MSLLAIAPEIPTQTPGVLAPQKYKSWLMIDSKNSNVTEIVSQLGIASALFSAGETRAKKSRGGAGNFYLVGHIWENGYLSYWRDSANSVACVAGAKRGREMGREKSTKEGKGKGGSLPLSPLPPSLFPFFPIPYPFRRLLRRLQWEVPKVRETRGVWGHVPQGNFENLSTLGCNLVQSER